MAAGPGTPPPRPTPDHAVLQGRRTRAPLLTQKHKSVPLTSRSLRGMILRPPRPPPPLKGQRGSNVPLLVEGGARGPRALRGSTDFGRARRGPGIEGGNFSMLGGQGGNPSLVSLPHSPYSHLPLLSLSLLQTFAFEVRG